MNGRTDGWAGGRAYGWMDGWADGGMDGRTVSQIDRCVRNYRHTYIHVYVD